MHIAFKRLFRIRVRHDWYAGGEIGADDFQVVPSASTAHLLGALGLRTRALPDGLVVYGEVEPGSTPPRLRRPLGADALRFAFELRTRHAALLAITDLPPFAPARTIFCFDNLREDVSAGRAHLGDAPAGVRIGSPVSLVTGPSFLHPLGAPAATAVVTIADRFGATVATVDAAAADGTTPFAAWPVDVGSAVGMAAGRYTITDSHGGVSRIYFDPDLAASRPLGILEIFSRTEQLTPDATNRVPASYRFLAGDEVSGFDSYYLQFQARATTWRYLVTKKYLNNAVALSSLKIGGPVTFAGTVSGARAVFTSTAAVRLAATPRGLKLLEHPSKHIRDLPDPDLRTPLGSDPALPAYVSEIHVYV